jgi:hypothetical protein
MTNWAITGDDGTVIAATASTSRTLVADVERKVRATDLMIWNPGPNLVYVRAGLDDVLATTASMPVPPGTLQPFDKGFSTHLAVICPAGQTQTVVAFVGKGT